MHISYAAKDREVVAIWLLPPKQGIWCTRGDAGGGQPVSHMHNLQGNTPETGRQVSLIQHGSDPISKCAISTFCYTVLMGLSTQSLLQLNATSSEVGFECIGYIFTTFVIAEGFNLLAKLSLKVCLERLECIKHLILGLEQVDSPVP